MYLPILATVFTSFFAALVTIKTLLPRLKERSLVGEDMHKPGKPQIPEMGGLAMVAGFNAGVFLTIGLSSFTPYLSIGLSLGYAPLLVTK